MENQNAYAPSADTVLEDVLDIPSPPRSAMPTGEQMLVLEDVIPAEEFSMLDESFEPPSEIMEADEESLLRTEPGTYILPGDAARLAGEQSPLAGPQVYGASETSSFDYDNGRAWLRLAPVLLLISAFVFFALYFLGNRMSGWGQKPQEVAANPAQAEPQSAAPAAAPEKVEQNTTPAALPESQGAVAVAKEETPAPAKEQATLAPAAKPSVETAKAESKPVESAPAAAAAPAPAQAVPAPAPVAQSSAGNFTVQVGSYNNSAQADERAGQLRSGGVEARVVRAEIPRRGTWYRVQAGRFASRDEATRFASGLKARGAADSFLIAELQGQ
jgi:cell division protein FtsN